jgi:hypothetical protein
MVAVPVGREPVSLIESVVLWVAKRRARTGKASSSGAVGWWTAELAGTLGGMTAFVVGGFLYAAPIVAWIVLGVALLLLDTKVSSSRRDRRRLRVPAAAAVTSSNRFVRE